MTRRDLRDDNHALCEKLVVVYLQYLCDPQFPLIVFAVKLEIQRANIYEVVPLVAHIVNGLPKERLRMTSGVVGFSYRSGQFTIAVQAR